jgi:hypothetical protein
MNIVVEATGARNVTRIYRSSDGRRMLLPMVARGPLRLAAYSSLLHGWGRGGLICDGPIDADSTDVVLQDLAELGGIATRIRVQPEHDHAWPGSRAHGFTSIPRVTHITDVSLGYEHLWTSVLSGRTRTKVRKATKAGVRVENASGATSVPVFYEIYEEWIRERAARRRLPVAALLAIGRRREPMRKFEVAARRIPGNLQIWVAYLDERPVAAAVQLVYGIHSTYWRGYSIREVAGRSRATYLLQARMIEAACRLGCRTYDMGESGDVESLMHFKEVFGATPRPYRELYREVVPVTRPTVAVRDAAIDHLGRRRTERSTDA